MSNETPPANPAPAPPKATPATPATSGKRSWSGLLVLVLAGALAGGGYLGWRAEQDLTTRLESLQSALDSQRVADASARSQIASTVGAAESAVESARTADLALSEKLKALEARVDTLAGKLATIPQNDADTLARLALAEVDALVRLAEQRLLLARDGAGATAALNLARARLPDEHTALGSAIAHDLAALAAFKDADLLGAAAEFSALASASRGWTAALQAPAEDAGKAAAAPAPGAGGWWGFLQAVWQDLRKLVEIHETGTGTDPLLDPLGASLSRQRFAVALEAARLAVLGRDALTRDAGVQAALAALAAGYAQDQAEVRQAVVRLQALASVELAPPLPVLTSPAASTARAP